MNAALRAKHERMVARVRLLGELLQRSPTAREIMQVNVVVGGNSRYFKNHTEILVAAGLPPRRPGTYIDGRGGDCILDHRIRARVLAAFPDPDPPAPPGATPRSQPQPTEPKRTAPWEMEPLGWMR